jgi:hypothetical protein
MAGLTALGVALSGAALAQTRPWVASGDVPFPAHVQSATVLRQDEPLYVRPEPGAPRRGSAALGARLPIFSAVRGPGCRGRWLGVGAGAWVCEDRVRMSAERPLAAGGIERFPDGLPYRYYFVGRDGTFAYRNLALAEEGAPDGQLEPGFAIAIATVADRRPGDPFGLTPKDLWVPMRDLTPARTLLFEGAELAGSLEVAWVRAESTPAYDAPGGKRLAGQAFVRFEKLHVVDEKNVGGRRWLRLKQGSWVNGRDVLAPKLAPAPAELLPAERWIDVEIATQTLVLYQGERPVFATLVSTGKGRDGTEQATPKGVHRIWVKLRTSDMDNLESEDASRYYAMQDVPWVMYFQKGYGLHGTFWHRSFGNMRSHGCVNLTPLDAQRLFHWTSPRMPAGWTAVLPNAYERGTLVRVR